MKLGINCEEWKGCMRKQEKLYAVWSRSASLPNHLFIDYNIEILNIYSVYASNIKMTNIATSII